MDMPTSLADPLWGPVLVREVPVPVRTERPAQAPAGTGPDTGTSPDTDFGPLAIHLSVLSDERRLKILFGLHESPGMRSSDIARAIGAHESTTSHALALLRETGWVRSRRTGREVRYELDGPMPHRILHEIGSHPLSCRECAA
jgi:DNA-binding transcriptional ArsR family regulator